MGIIAPSRGVLVVEANYGLDLEYDRSWDKMFGREISSAWYYVWQNLKYLEGIELLPQLVKGHMMSVEGGVRYLVT